MINRYGFNSDGIQEVKKRLVEWYTSTMASTAAAAAAATAAATNATHAATDGSTYAAAAGAAGAGNESSCRCRGLLGVNLGKNKLTEDAVR